MDGNQNENNNVGKIYCSQCGSLNETTSNFCIKCGARISRVLQNQIVAQPIQQANKVQPPRIVKEKNPYEPFLILLGVASIFVSVFVDNLYILVLVAAIASLFSKKTKPYGLTIFAAIGLGLASLAIMAILLGICFGSINHNLIINGFSFIF